MPNEPSMEEILSSIKRIIADDDRAIPRAPRRAAPASAPRIAEDDDEQILELTDALPAETPQDQSARAPAARMEEESPVPTPTRAEAKPARTAEAKASRSEPRPARDRAATETKAKPAPSPAVLSDMTATAARKSLEELSHMLVRGEEGASNTLEGLVREMLRPMLKEWLDAHLPELVETLVKREIARITGRV